IMGVQQMVRQKKTLLGDEMGLGKTLEMICVFLLSEQKELLVSTLKTGLPGWMQELSIHTDVSIELAILADQAPDPSLDDNKKIVVLPLRTKKQRYEYLLKPRPEPAGLRVILINHELLPFYEKHRNKIGKPAPRVPFIVIDEAHLLKE